MATRYRFRPGDAPHFITYSVVSWVDALSRPVYKDIVIKSLEYCIAEKGLVLHAWVIMNNHVHLIASSDGRNKMEDIMRDHKKFTALQIINAIETNDRESRRNWMLWLFKASGQANPNNEKYQFWQQDNHPVQLTSAEMTLQKLNYLHSNPVNAGLVFEPHHYVYSSAIDYYSSKKGLLPIEHLM